MPTLVDRTQITKKKGRLYWVSGGRVWSKGRGAQERPAIESVLLEKIPPGCLAFVGKDGNVYAVPAKRKA